VELENVSKNKRRSKKKKFNEFSKVTDLVRIYKASNRDDDLLEIIKSVEGIINTYTIVLSPGNGSQQIYVTPYMKKFLGMFFTAEEKANASIQTYYKVIDRVRWIMRRSSYEDIYSEVLCLMINTIKKMKIIENCDCIYFIQLILKFKIYDLVLRTSNDAAAAVADLAIYEEETTNVEDLIMRLSLRQEDLHGEEEHLIDSLYRDVGVNVLLRKDDIFKVYSPYEKYLIYLKDILGLTMRQILSILKYETEEELNARFEDISYKCELIMNEGD
jgi:hypothetical protein